MRNEMQSKKNMKSSHFQQDQFIHARKVSFLEILVSNKREYIKVYKATNLMQNWLMVSIDESLI